MTNKDCYKASGNNYNANYLSAAFFKGIFFDKKLTSFSGSAATMSITDRNDIF